MPWRTLTTADVIVEFTPSEQATLKNISGLADNLTPILADTIGEFLGAMGAADYAIAADGSVPDQFRRHIIARARWGWLAAYPALEVLRTDARKEAAQKAEAILEKIAQRQVGAIEAPVPATTATGNWNSENRLIMRTHPIPPASTQFTPGTTQQPYANPDAPADQ